MRFSVNVSFAGISIKVNYSSSHFYDLIKDFVTEEKEECECVLTQSMIEKEKKSLTTKQSDGYLELLAFIRSFCSYAALRNTILFHSTVVTYKGDAYVFAAPSGVGKTTHAKLWMDLLGDKARILNGDKPFIRVLGKEDIPVVFGSPLKGKEGYGYNGSMPLKGICFISRGTENEIEKISHDEALKLAYRQLFLPEDNKSATNSMNVLISIVNNVPTYKLKCTKDIEAAKLSFETMTGEKI